MGQPEIVDERKYLTDFVVEYVLRENFKVYKKSHSPVDYEVMFILTEDFGRDAVPVHEIAGFNSAMPFGGRKSNLLGAIAIDGLNRDANFVDGSKALPAVSQAKSDAILPIRLVWVPKLQIGNSNERTVRGEQILFSGICRFECSGSGHSGGLIRTEQKEALPDGYCNKRRQ